MRVEHTIGRSRGENRQRAEASAGLADRRSLLGYYAHLHPQHSAVTQARIRRFQSLDSDPAGAPGQPSQKPRLQIPAPLTVLGRRAILTITW